MKHLLYIVLFFCSWVYGQEKINADEQEILYLEVNRLKDDFIVKPPTAITGDSIVVNKALKGFWPYINNYRTHSIKNGLTEAEAQEIFGGQGEVLYDMPTEPFGELKHCLFKGLKVFLFDENNHSASEFEYSGQVKKSIGTDKVLYLSRPVIRKDGKFALIEFSGGIHGGVMSVYKKIEKEWVFYKTIYLYVI